MGSGLSPPTPPMSIVIFPTSHYKTLQIGFSASCNTSMSDKRKRPMAGKLITSGLRSGLLEAGTSPTTPLEFKVLSPTGIIKCEIGGIGIGIGLGMVAALEKTHENIPAKKSNFRCRNPIGDEADSLEEEYTKVTRKPIEIRKQASIFDISPANFSDDDMKMCRASEFLSSCHLCNKKLHGRDIYMYRGDKAFCSPECRSKQILMDERREKRFNSQATSSPSNATSHHVLTTGIFVI